MEILFEFIFELIMDSSIEIAKDKKVNKWIRYPVALFLLLFIIAVLVTLFIVGVVFIFDKELNIKLAGVFFIIVDIVLIVCAIKKISKIRKQEEQKN